MHTPSPEIQLAARQCLATFSDYQLECFMWAFCPVEMGQENDLAAVCEATDSMVLAVVDALCEDPGLDHAIAQLETFRDIEKVALYQFIDIATEWVDRRGDTDMEAGVQFARGLFGVEYQPS